MVAAYWGDVDLRTCRPEFKARCSYWKVYYGQAAGFLNDKITNDYFSSEQTFTAKVAIVQTWDRVSYYDTQIDKSNTFQIVIVSDGDVNSFAGLFYGDIQWTTGDSSDGVEGLGGTPAQMGFDAGDEKNFYAHPFSRTTRITELANKEFLYAISATKICGAGEQLTTDFKCIPLSCAIPDTVAFPLKDAQGNKKFKDNGLINPAFGGVTNVMPGTCKDFLTDKYVKEKVLHGKECKLECRYDTKTWKTYQPLYLGDDAKTTKGTTAKCEASEWVENAAKNCVAVGINYNVVGSSSLQLREGTQGNTQEIEVSLKSKPYSTGNVYVELKTSCKGGSPLKEDGAGSNKYYCNDDPRDGNVKTTPLAAFKIGNKEVYVTTLVFGPAKKWNTPQKITLKGMDNTRKSNSGLETLKVFLSVSKADTEDCKTEYGCAVSSPYGSFKKIEELSGELLDDESLELVALDKGITDESGKESKFSLDARGTGANSVIGDKLSCTSNKPTEGKITHYMVNSDAKQTYEDNAKITLGKNLYTFIVTGQRDESVDGPKEFKITCSLETSQGAILPLKFLNNDQNVPAVIVETITSNHFQKSVAGTTCDFSSGVQPAHVMVDGCGLLKVSESGSKSDTFTVRLGTKPLGDNNVIIEVTAWDQGEVAVSPSSMTFDKDNWDVAQKFEVLSAGDDGIRDGNVITKIDVAVDTTATTDKGETKELEFNGEIVNIYGYSNCAVTENRKTSGAKKRRLDVAAKAAKKREKVTERLTHELKCFSHRASKVTGFSPSGLPDQNRLVLEVETEDDVFPLGEALGIGAAAIGGIVAVIIVVLIICAIISALAIRKIQKSRGEQADKQAEKKEHADKAEGEIAFRMDEMENVKMEDVEGVTTRLKGERDRLRDENVKLAASAGEEPMLCADTEDNELLVEQIKELKSENDRLRDANKNKKRNRKKKKGKATGFGQQQED